MSWHSLFTFHSFILFLKSAVRITKLNLVLSFTGQVRCQQQYFRVPPSDIDAGEGSVAVIPCEVGHRAGRVQWTKDGLTLGRTPIIFLI